jgi:hypothetical protein
VPAARPHGTERWHRRAAYGVAALRLALGTVALALPEPSGDVWIGSGGTGRKRAVLVRALACRDVALGLGAVLALRSGEGADLWVAMGALSDMGDAMSTAAGFTAFATWRRWAVVLASTGAAAAGAVYALMLAPARRRR